MLGLMLMIFFLLNSTDAMCVKREFSTKYFRVIYEEELEPHALILKERADELAEKEFEFYEFKPDFTINIVLIEGETANAYAAPPFGTMFFYTNLPYLEEKNFEHWMEHLLVHELSHTLLGLKLHGEFAINLYTKNSKIQHRIIPQWLDEGLAVYLESALLKGGRVNSSFFNRTIKMEAKNSFKGLSLVASFDHGDYDGNGYTHGSSFITYYVNKYGEDVLLDALNRMRKSYLLRALKSMAEAAGTSEKELMEGWHKYLLESNKFDYDKAVEGERVIEGRNGKLTKDGEYLYFIRKNGAAYNLYRFGIYEKMEKFGNQNIRSTFNIFNSKVYTSENYELSFGDLNFLLMPKSLAVYENGKYLPFKDAISAFNTPDGLFYIERKFGFEKLKTEEGDTLLENLNFGNFFHSNGKLFFDGSIPGEVGNYIFEYDLNTGELSKVVEGEMPFIENGYLYFTCGKDGSTYNIYRKRMDNDTIEQITNVEYAAMRPVILNNVLYYQNYKEDGPNIFKIENIEPVSKCENSLEGRGEVLKLKQKMTNKEEGSFGKRYSKKANSVSLGYSRIVIPFGKYRDIRLFKVLADDLFRHFGIVSFAYDFREKSPSSFMAYHYLNRFTLSMDINRSFDLQIIENFLPSSLQSTKNFIHKHFVKNKDKNLSISAAGTIPFYIKSMKLDLNITSGIVRVLEKGEGSKKSFLGQINHSNGIFIYLDIFSRDFGVRFTPKFTKFSKIKMPVASFGISKSKFSFSYESMPVSVTAHKEEMDKIITTFRKKKCISLTYSDKLTMPVMYGSMDGFFAVDSCEFKYSSALHLSNSHSTSLILDGKFVAKGVSLYIVNINLMVGVKFRAFGDKSLGGLVEGGGRAKPYFDLDAGIGLF